MVFIQCSILYRERSESPEVDENRSPFVRQGTERIELYLDPSAVLKTVSCHLLSWLTR